MVGDSVVWPITLTPLGYSNSQPHWKAYTWMTAPGLGVTAVTSFSTTTVAQKSPSTIRMGMTV